MRPVPLLKGSHLINFLEPHPLTNHSGMHAGYLSRKVVGDVLVVGQDPDDSAALVDFFESLPRVQHVTYVPNQTSVNAEVKAHDLGVGNKLFDSIVYSKSKTAWLGRAPDFHRLSTRIKDGGTLIAKTKWVPDSRLLSLEEIAVHGAYKYSLPVVYLRFVKSQRTLPTLSTLADGSDGESGHDEERAPSNPARQSTARFQNRQMKFGLLSTRVPERLHTPLGGPGTLHSVRSSTTGSTLSRATSSTSVAGRTTKERFALTSSKSIFVPKRK